MYDYGDYKTISFCNEYCQNDATRRRDGDMGDMRNCSESYKFYNKTSCERYNVTVNIDEEERIIEFAIDWYNVKRFKMILIVILGSIGVIFVCGCLMCICITCVCEKECIIAKMIYKKESTTYESIQEPDDL